MATTIHTDGIGGSLEGPAAELFLNHVGLWRRDVARSMRIGASTTQITVPNTTLGLICERWGGLSGRTDDQISLLDRINPTSVVFTPKLTSTWDLAVFAHPEYGLWQVASLNVVIEESACARGALGIPSTPVGALLKSREATAYHYVALMLNTVVDHGERIRKAGGCLWLIC